MQNKIPKNWQNIKFKNFITLQRGFDLPQQNIIEGSYPILGSTAILGHHNEYKVEPPGVTTGRSGSLGSVLYTNKKYWPHNTSLWVKDFKKNVPRFVYYFLTSFPFNNFNSGAGVPTLNRNHLNEYEVLIPEVPIQQKIASILLSFDNLIENNRWRIETLEEMAQWLYREWFVEFRFPGHEKVKMVNSELGKIPKGWQVVKVANIVDRKSPGKLYDSNTTSEKGKVPVLDQGQTGIIGYHNDEPGFIASTGNPIIIFANHTCYQRIINFPFSAIQNVIPFKSGDKNPRNIYWLHYATDELIEFNDYKGHWPEFMTKKLSLPPNDICEQFGQIVKDFIKDTFFLERLNSNLSKTRDLLLSKLMSGEIEV